MPEVVALSVLESPGGRFPRGSRLDLPTEEAQRVVSMGVARWPSPDDEPGSMEAVCLLQALYHEGESHPVGKIITVLPSLAERLISTNVATHVFGGPCTPQTVRCGAATSYYTATPDCCRNHVTRIFAQVDELARAAGIRWWLDYGSAAGAHYYQGMIPHDKDGDAGVLGEDWGRFLALAPALKAKGLFVIHKPPRNAGKYGAGNSVKVCVSESNRTNVDFFPWYPSQEVPGHLERKAYISADRNKGREFPARWLGDLPRVPYESLQLPVPADLEGLVRHRYPNWVHGLTANNDGVRR
jgi:hypothetical protein